MKLFCDAERIVKRGCAQGVKSASKALCRAGHGFAGRAHPPRRVAAICLIMLKRYQLSRTLTGAAPQVRFNHGDHRDHGGQSHAEEFDAWISDCFVVPAVR
jgi:hypothetical protein